LNQPKRPTAKALRTAEPEVDPSDAADATVAEVADYIGQIAGEIASMARDAKLDMLAYFLTMARMEAELVASKSRWKDDLLDDDLPESGTWPSAPRRR